MTRTIFASAGALLLVLTGCSSSGKGGTDTSSNPPGDTGASTTSSSPAAGSSAASTSDPLSQANIDKIIASYNGQDSKYPKTFGPAKKAALKIGWSAARKANELNARLGSAIELATKAMGGSFTALDANGDVPTQVHQVQQLINEHVDAILIWPLDANSLDSVFKQAKAKKIPVIAVGITPDGTSIGSASAQIIYGADKNAYLEAKVMSQILPAGSQVATMKYTVAVPYIVYYVQRLAYWAKQDGLDVVADVANNTDDVPGGQQAAGPLLQKYPNLKGMLPYNDASALGTAAAATTINRKLTIFGTNGEDEGLAGIKAGKYSLTIQPPIAMWGKEMVAAAYRAKAGESIPKTVYTGVGYVITKNNIGQAKELLDRINATTYGP